MCLCWKKRAKECAWLHAVTQARKVGPKHTLLWTKSLSQGEPVHGLVMGKETWLCWGKAVLSWRRCRCLLQAQPCEKPGQSSPSLGRGLCLGSSAGMYSALQAPGQSHWHCLHSFSIHMQPPKSLAEKLRECCSTSWWWWGLIKEVGSSFWHTVVLSYVLYPLQGSCFSHPACRSRMSVWVFCLSESWEKEFWWDIKHFPLCSRVKPAHSLKNLSGVESNIQITNQKKTLWITECFHWCWVLC